MRREGGDHLSYQRTVSNFFHLNQFQSLVTRKRVDEDSGAGRKGGLPEKISDITRRSVGRAED